MGTEPVTLRDAAIQLYEASQAIRMEWTKELMSRGKLSDAEERDAMLNYVAMKIAEKVPIRGRREETCSNERIEVKTLHTSKFAGGAKDLRNWLYDGVPSYTDLTIGYAELKDLIDQAHLEDGFRGS